MHTFHKVSTEEIFSNIHALKLLHSLKLLLSLFSCVLQSLIFLLDSCYFSFDLHLPICIFNLSSFMIFIFELSNFFKFMLLFNFQDTLLYRLIQKNIKDWLYLNIIIKQIIVFNLGNFIDTSLFRNVFWSWGFRLENICLQFHFCLICFSFTLLCKEVS